MWLVALFVGVVASANTKVLVVDYDGGPTWGNAWITLHVLGDPAQLLTLQRVTWCKSLIPNSLGPPELAQDCTGRNLMFLQLYPSRDSAVLKEPPASMPDQSDATPQDNTFYVDPAHVGGWDVLHQWQIILEMSQRDGTTFRQVVRFNPIVPTTTTTTTLVTTAQVTTTPETTSSSNPQGSTSSSGTTEGAIQERHHAWGVALVVLCVGVAIVGAMGGTVLYIQRAGQGGLLALSRQRAQAVSRAYAGSYEFGFSTDKPVQEDIEMTDLASEERRLQREDMEILENMH